MLQDELRQEKQNRERLSREKDILSADKYALEQNVNVRIRISIFACMILVLFHFEAIFDFIF